MRTRISIIAVYLLLCCMLFEHALPCFLQADLVEIYESKTESEGKDTKTEKESSDEWKALRDRFHLVEHRISSYLSHNGSLLAGSEEIPDSAHQPIFSPPPNKA